jgi:hypothetical protein
MSAWPYAVESMLARRGQVLPQHLIDPPRHRLPDRRSPHRDLTIRRHRRRDRLPDRPAVHVILPRQRPDRHPMALPVKADRREQLHSPLHPAPPDQEEHPTQPRSGQPAQMSRNTPGVSPATPTRWGQIRREPPPPRYSRWGPSKGEQWGHFRVLQPLDELIAGIDEFQEAVTAHPTHHSLGAAMLGAFAWLDDNRLLERIASYPLRLRDLHQAATAVPAAQTHPAPESTRPRPRVQGS